MIDAEALEEALTALRQSPELTRDVAAGLQATVDATVALFAVTGSGLMFVNDAQALRYVAASDEGGRILESSHEEVGEGPCVDALVSDEIFVSADIQQDSRWPRLAARLTGSPVHAVLGVPVRLGGGPVGSLNVYADSPREWDDSDIVALQAFNTVIEELIGAAVLARRHEAVVEQLQHALDHRVSIERAVGVLMGRHSLDAVTAFNRLRVAARSQRRKVVDVAQDVLQGADA
jgi:GAF domain-containing protein